MVQVKEEAYVGIHMRRGDKLLHEAKRHETEVRAVKPEVGGQGGGHYKLLMYSSIATRGS